MIQVSPYFYEFVIRTDSEYVHMYKSDSGQRSRSRSFSYACHHNVNPCFQSHPDNFQKIIKSICESWSFFTKTDRQTKLYAWNMCEQIYICTCEIWYLKTDASLRNHKVRTTEFNHDFHIFTTTYWSVLCTNVFE